MTQSRPLSIVVAARRLSDLKLVQVGEACSRLGAQVRLCNVDQLPCAEGEVLIAGLGEEEPRIPDECIAFLERRDSRAALLLLSEHALKRPRVELSNGVVTLLSRELGSDAIYSRLRVLLAERRAGEHDDEVASGRLWTASFRCRRGKDSARLLTRDALTLGFELGSDERDSHDWKQLLDAARAGFLVPAVDVGLLRFEAARDEWQLAWPNRSGTLWLLSPSRSPRVRDVGGEHCVGIRRLHAQSGDILLAVAGLASSRAEELVTALLPHVPSGAPVVFDALQAGLESLPNVRASIVELR